MNFAEAALLIQGSACIYSRKVASTCSAFGSLKQIAILCVLHWKVEYLYSLVYQALELMASKRLEILVSL